MRTEKASLGKVWIFLKVSLSPTFEYLQMRLQIHSEIAAEQGFQHPTLIKCRGEWWGVGTTLALVTPFSVASGWQGGLLEIYHDPDWDPLAVADPYVPSAYPWPTPIWPGNSKSQRSVEETRLVSGARNTFGLQEF